MPRGMMQIDFIEITFGVRVKKGDPMYRAVLEAAKGGAPLKLPNGTRLMIGGSAEEVRKSKADELREQTMRAIGEARGNFREAAIALGITYSAVRQRFYRYKQEGHL